MQGLLLNNMETKLKPITSYLIYKLDKEKTNVLGKKQEQRI